MRFGLQRSVIFWAGVLMTVFIGWAVRDSRERMAVVKVGPCQLMSVCGGVALLRTDPLPGGSFWYTGHAPAPLVRRGFEDPFFLRGREEFTAGNRPIEDEGSYQDYAANMLLSWRKDEWMFFVPYWLLWMMMGVLWVVLLVWRQRRGGRYSRDEG